MAFNKPLIRRYLSTYKGAQKVQYFLHRSALPVRRMRLYGLLRMLPVAQYAARCRAGQYASPYGSLQRATGRASMRAYMVIYGSFRSLAARRIVLLVAGGSVYMQAYMAAYGSFQRDAGRASM